ncbi:hypothetical protein C8R43DRAFT_975701 [Mycena crocata]|nr:hypothetical protein C8R43DRAFT_975701 [Mycena crocata]
MSAPIVTEQLVAETLGVVVIGVLVNTLLLGVVFMQWVTYWTNNFKDPWQIQCLVYWMITLDIAHTCISWEYLWMYTVRKFGDVNALLASHWEYDSGPIFIIFCAVPTQFFLAWRIRKLVQTASRRLGNLIFGVTVLCSLLQAFFGLYMSGSLLEGVNSTAGYVKFVKISVAWESFAIATDMTIMLSSIATLMYKRTGFRHTNSLIMNLTVVSVECAIPVTLFTIGHMTGVIASPTTGIHQLFAWSQARLYSNTLFVNLNVRAKFRQTPDASYASGGRNNDVNTFNGVLGHSHGRQAAQVRIDVTREEAYVMESTASKVSNRSNSDFKTVDNM